LKKNLEIDQLTAFKKDVLLSENMRDVLEAGRLYYRQHKQERTFAPGETYIPVSGKVLDEEDLCSLLESSLDMWLTAGRFSTQFEELLSSQFNIKHSLLTVSGSAANLLAFSALTSSKLQEKRIAPGSEVITVASGFPTTVAPIIQNNCIPVFVDVELPTYNVDISQLEAAITKKTRAIVLAHTLGNPFNLEKVKKIADEFNLYLIEDCCDALGSTYDGKQVGSFGDIATLSFYPAHHITTGEGGAVMTNRLSLKKLIESFRDWGRDCWCEPGKDNTCNKRLCWKLGELPYGYDHKYTYSHLGYNMKMTDMQAALGASQITKLSKFVEARRENYEFFYSAFKRDGLEEHFILPEATLNSNPSWFGFPLTIRDESPLDRRSVIEYLENNRIGTRLLFAGNMVRQPAFIGTNHRVASDLKTADKIMNDSFWIGVWPGIKEKERDYIVDQFNLMIRKMTK